MKIHDCHCSFHLGDLFCAAHLLRHLAKLHPQDVFRFAMHPCYLPEVLPMTEDLPNFVLTDIEQGIPEGSLDLWKQHENFWASHPLKHDYAAFTRRYYRRVIRKFEFTDPAPGLLFDFPALEGTTTPSQDYDILVVNSNPQSAQFLDYVAEDSLEPMVRALAAKNRVLTTKPVSGIKCTFTRCATIGRMSNGIPHHIMVSTGPSWFTFNKWSQPKTRILMIGNGEHVDLTGDTENYSTIAATMAALERKGLI